MKFPPVFFNQRFRHVGPWRVARSSADSSTKSGGRSERLVRDEIIHLIFFMHMKLIWSPERQYVLL